MADFFAMGGYAFYIWGSFGVTLVLMIAEIVMVRRQHRTLRQRLGRMMRMNAGESNNEA
ncbi:MAG: heme exporter protein CcmD [Gammaproteobacteria bacterium]|nr:heme exporter protein CcmD [Gammaproteobacteria bacterium]